MGELHLIIGCMFSGKTTELLRTATRFKSIGKSITIINFAEDTRYSSTDVTTHDKYSCIDIKSHYTHQLDAKQYEDYSVICINEAQFFTGLKEFCISLMNKCKIVYVSGLDGDFQQNPFGEILQLIPLCNTVTRLNALCKLCGNGKFAYFTKRLTDSKEQKLIGTEQYIPVCREHLF